MKRKDGPSREVSFPGCPAKIQVPTEKEQEALSVLKSIKERRRSLKERIAALKASHNPKDAQKAAELDEEMRQLKAEWQEWEKRKEKAAEERMIILGHKEEP